MGARQPRRLIPRKVSGVYTQSLHRDHHGEFDFNLEWKPVESYPVYAGWLRAVRRGHAELHRGLDVPAPAWCCPRRRSAWPTTMGEAVHSNDVVLDVEQIRRWASSLGRHVTSIAVDGRATTWCCRCRTSGRGSTTSSTPGCAACVGRLTAGPRSTRGRPPGATTPTTTMKARSTGAGRRATDRGADHATDDGTHRDEPDDLPVDVGEQDEEHARRSR